MKETRMYKSGSARSLRVSIADTFLRRFLGLMGRRCLAPDVGLLITPCNSVHMCFMRFAIDVVYLVPEADGYRVAKVVEHLRPWFGLSACCRAKCTLELAAGVASSYGIATGNFLQSEPKN